MDHASPHSAPGPSVSIVLPSFNEQPATIDRCVASLLGQTLGDFECLVMDDSTEEASRARWRHWHSTDPRIQHVIPARRLGLAASLNQGIQRARGEFIARVDTDDPCAASRLEAQTRFLREHPSIDIVGSALALADEDSRDLGIRRYPARHEEIAARMRWSTGIAHPSVLARRQAYLEFGLYDESFTHCEDLELWLRWLGRGARFANLPEPLVTCGLDMAGRPRKHWRRNVRARVKNFSWGPGVGRQMLGISFASIAATLPSAAFARIQLALHGRRGEATDPAKAPRRGTAV